ncbi:metal-sensing transcriptional repressor [Allorhizobium sp. NPDC080224]|uniref:metal-sensing transcriptional repressor n=1 Tax=Hyphomicrobiales TaxID=356 RepID=UPI000BE3F31F|nr:metal-sensing transcriptional repressor [Brucella intermedia]
MAKCGALSSTADRIAGRGSTSNLHETHPHIVKRLKRARGHRGSVIEMIEEAKRCLDHFDHCLEETVGSLPRQKSGSVDVFKEAKYL